MSFFSAAPCHGESGKQSQALDSLRCFLYKVDLIQIQSRDKGSQTYVGKSKSVSCGHKRADRKLQTLVDLYCGSCGDISGKLHLSEMDIRQFMELVRIILIGKSTD